MTFAQGWSTFALDRYGLWKRGFSPQVDWKNRRAIIDGWQQVDKYR
ncbi:MAG: hypothetical protein ABFD24_05100 [Anaerolineaceae bacterium]